MPRRMLDAPVPGKIQLIEEDRKPGKNQYSCEKCRVNLLARTKWKNDF